MPIAQPFTHVRLDPRWPCAHIANLTVRFAHNIRQLLDDLFETLIVQTRSVLDGKGV
jgi:hypothetical protein